MQFNNISNVYTSRARVYVGKGEGDCVLREESLPPQLGTQVVDQLQKQQRVCALVNSRLPYGVA